MDGAKFAELRIDGKAFNFPIIIGSEGEKAIDISNLRKETGYITLDPSFANTGACCSEITYIDGERGILRYRGIPIEELAEKRLFIEVAYLLLHGNLPDENQYKQFSILLNEHSLLHEDMRHLFDGFPRGSHPMHIMSTMLNSMATFYPNVDTLSLSEDIDVTATRLISTFRTMAAFAYKKSIGQPPVYPRPDLTYCANFLNMMFDSPVNPYTIDAEIVEVMNLLFILYADHEQNCSTTTVRTIGSAQVNLYATISAGVSALSGPLHGGANQAVIEMLSKIRSGGYSVDQFIEMAKNKNNPVKLMGFGHRVYKNYDPRAKIIKEATVRILKKLDIKDTLLDIAMELESKALSDSYFVERKLYPNVDFYSGILYRALGFPTNMFTVLFALGRLPGWIAHWKEMVSDKNSKIVRPRQIYTGRTLTHLK
jgi:citrate synthase